MQSDHSPENQLRPYILAKHQAGELLRAGLQLFQEAKKEQAIEQCRSLLVRLAEDRFNLAVVGQFKRGKSSLMNAVIGRDLLPTGLLPLTSAITTLGYGPQERVLLKRKGWSLDQEIPLTDLAGYVTEQGNPGNGKGILEARVELAVPFLRRGLHFIDTPGIGSARQENTATTYAFLPETDAVIFVTSVEAPLSQAEESFLQDIRQHVRKLFIVVNKMDLLTQEEHDQVLDYIRTGITKIIGTTDFRIYPLSARQGLQAKLEGNGEGVLQSGLADFEAALASFLAEEKSQVFLVSILDRAERLLADFKASSRPGPPSHGASANGSRLPEQLLASLETLRTAIQADGAVPLGKVAFSTAIPPEPLHQAVAASRREQKPSDEQPLGMTRACPICAAQSQAVFDFFVHWQNALMDDEDARRAFAAARGLCWLHTWQFQQVASPLGISEGYASLVETTAAALYRLVERPPQEGAAGIGNHLPSSESCAACQIVRNTGAAQIARFVAYVTTPEGRAQYQRSLGLCLPHLRAALLSSPSQEIAGFLLEEQAKRLEEISEDLRSFVLKREALRRGLVNANEEKAWLRALLLLAGERTAHALG